MEGPLLAVATTDFGVYHDLLRALARHGLRTLSLSPGERTPRDVALVVTTAAEAPRVDHPDVVVYTTPEATVEEVLRRLMGLTDVRTLVLGVDPGDHPGLAAVADGQVVWSRQLSGPDRLVPEVRAALRRFSATHACVRIGHGAPTLRDRALNEMLEIGVDVELVDETSTSPLRARHGGERDAAAARAIALTPGVPVHGPVPVLVRSGEVRDIQARSREASGGQVTISRALARRVAQGRMTMAEAVRRQQRPGRLEGK